MALLAHFFLSLQEDKGSLFAIICLVKGRFIFQTFGFRASLNTSIFLLSYLPSSIIHPFFSILIMTMKS